MKTNILKRSIAITGLSLLTMTAPLMAQSDTASSSTAPQSTRTEMYEPAGADEDRGSNLWWLGLLGLLGLFGLKRRHAHDENYTSRTTGPARA